MCKCAQLCPPPVTPGPVAQPAPLSMRLSRQEHQSGLPCPPLGDLPDPGIELVSRALQSDSSTIEPPGKPSICVHITIFNDIGNLFIVSWEFYFFILNCTKPFILASQRKQNAKRFTKRWMIRKMKTPKT